MLCLLGQDKRVRTDTQTKSNLIERSILHAELDRGVGTLPIAKLEREYLGAAVPTESRGDAVVHPQSHNRQWQCSIGVTSGHSGTGDLSGQFHFHVCHMKPGAE